MYLGSLPEWAAYTAEALYNHGMTPRIPDQLIVNEYEPGQGISAHIDCGSCFDDTIAILSLVRAV
jgi:alkylated DNA repair dioxygenase AlkB